MDGFKLIYDCERSRGSRFVDAASGRTWIDLYSFYASQPIGYNHPHFDEPAVREELARAAKFKIAKANRAADDPVLARELWQRSLAKIGYI